MTRAGRTIEEHRCGADVAAYALGALDPDDVAAFERHLNSCAVCPEELTRFEQAVSRLAMSAPPCPAPPELRRRVLSAVAPQTVPPPTRRRSRRAGRRWPRTAVTVGAALALAAATVAGLKLPRSGSTPVRVIAAQVTGPGTAQVRVTGDHAQLIVHRFSPPPAGEIYSPGDLSWDSWVAQTCLR